LAASSPFIFCSLRGVPPFGSFFLLPVFFAGFSGHICPRSSRILLRQFGIPRGGHLLAAFSCLVQSLPYLGVFLLTAPASVSFILIFCAAPYTCSSSTRVPAFLSAVEAYLTPLSSFVSVCRLFLVPFQTFPVGF